jgi:hypothetical protein
LERTILEIPFGSLVTLEAYDNALYMSINSNQSFTILSVPLDDIYTSPIMLQQKAVIPFVGGDIKSTDMRSYEHFLYVVGTYTSTFTVNGVSPPDFGSNTTSSFLMAISVDIAPSYRPPFYIVGWKDDVGDMLAKSLNYDPNSQQVLVGGDANKDIFAASFDSWTGKMNFLRRYRLAKFRSLVTNRDNTYMLGVYHATLFKNCTDEFANSTFIAKFTTSYFPEMNSPMWSMPLSNESNSIFPPAQNNKPFGDLLGVEDRPSGALTILGMSFNYSTILQPQLMRFNSDGAFLRSFSLFRASTEVIDCPSIITNRMGQYYVICNMKGKAPKLVNIDPCGLCLAGEYSTEKQDYCIKCGMKRAQIDV